MSYTCIIVDDEPLSHQVLKNHIAQVKSLKTPISFFNAIDAKAFLAENVVDIMLLDIQMPEITGLEFLKGLNNRPVTIFSTAYRKYALDGFDLGVADYLLKPISFKRFEVAIQRAIDLVESKKTDKNYEIEIRTGTQTILLDYREIEYAKGLKDYTILYLPDKKYVVLGSLKSYEESLPTQYFMRVHKSYMIAKNKIKNINQQKILWNQAAIPIGRSYKAKVEEFLKGNK
ncbi:LytTR family DNA-binding domain-containing protein [Emticicia sp. BO119]|uniref:LytR/AlgR family response regulator transcription factor n=1 Tax=Emticicia sp. BO119 TaxID=2757768 RepID=UPI0015F04D35|nr:LytTR family DNA-binding domain-containing protein [Emticicia sp. BO119]MBA4850888.1 response regulator transcription factor [Emticicia sp. BO119]